MNTLKKILVFILRYTPSLVPIEFLFSKFKFLLSNQRVLRSTKRVLKQVHRLLEVLLQRSLPAK